MKSIITTTIVLFLVYLVSAQNPRQNPALGGNAKIGNIDEGANKSTLVTSIGRSNYEGDQSIYKEIQGSPFLSDEPIYSTLVQNDGGQLDNIPLRIDLYTNTLIATDEWGDEMVLNELVYKEIRLPFEGQETVFKRLHNKYPAKFYQVLHEEDGLVFFKERKVSLREAYDDGIKKVEPKFLHRIKYYIRNAEGKVSKVKLKKKSIFSNIPQDRLDAMITKTGVKEKKLKLKSEADFVAFFNGNY